MPQTIIRCEKLCLSYESKSILEDIELEIEENDYISVVGENGSGKSTLLKGILGLIKPTSGLVRFENGFRQSDIGYLPQQTALQKDFPASVFEVILSGCTKKMGSIFYSKAEKSLAESKMDILRIRELKNCSYKELSGGQQQRVLLARALCSAKKLLLLDEPVSGLDPKATTELYEIIESLNEDKNMTIMMTTHDNTSFYGRKGKVLHIGFGIEFYGIWDDYLKTDIGKSYWRCACHD